MKDIYVIAEAGVNHNGDVAMAMDLVRAASDAGANGVKFQSFSAHSLALNSVPKVAYQKRSGPVGQGQFEMLQQLELSDSDFESLFSFGLEIGIDVFSTPYDTQKLSFLESVGVPFLKIASADIVDLELLTAAQETGIPTLLSTGMSTMSEVEAAVSVFAGNTGKLSLLHSTSSYPAPSESLNLLAITSMRERFGLEVGYSDHTIGNDASLMSLALGARIFERHLTLDVGMSGPDHAASLDPHRFGQYVDALRSSFVSLGNGIKEPTESELEMRLLARKKLAYAQNMPTGEVLTRDKLLFVRGGGLELSNLPEVIGKVLAKDVNGYTPVNEKDFH